MLGSGEAFTQGLSDGARRQLVWWLGGSAALVYGVVVLAGTARVTRCVLSLTELRLAGEHVGWGSAQCVHILRTAEGGGRGSVKTLKSLIQGFHVATNT